MLLCYRDCNIELWVPKGWLNHTFPAFSVCRGNTPCMEAGGTHESLTVQLPM